MLQDLRALVVPDGTETIEENQYKGKDYERVFIPKSVTEIRHHAFSECENLKVVVFEEGSMLKTIGEDAFNACRNLAEINLPKGLESIGSWAFYECKNLKNIRLPDGLMEIGV